jgi:hypothetical protein
MKDIGVKCTKGHSLDHFDIEFGGFTGALDRIGENFRREQMNPTSKLVIISRALSAPFDAFSVSD